MTDRRSRPAAVGRDPVGLIAPLRVEKVAGFMEHIHNWNLSLLLEAAAQTHGERPFLIGTRCLTYAEAVHQVRALAAGLQQIGVRRGERVLVATTNRLEVALIAFAAARLGAIFTILNPTIKPYGFRQIRDQVEPAVVVLDDATAGLAGEAADVPIIWSGDAPAPDGMIPFTAALQEPDHAALAFPGIDLDPVCLIYTSGSTSAPRGVTISHDNIRFATAAIQARLRYRPDDVIGLFLPLSFDYGLYQVFLAAAAGASLYVGRPEAVGPELLSILAQRNITILPGVPTLFAALLKLLTRLPRPLPALRCVTNTGEHLPRASIDRLRQLLPELQIFAMYGLTECKRISILLPDELDARPESVGRPLTGTEAYVVDEQGRRLPPGSIGELVVRGRHVTLGYWRAPEETRRRFRQPAPTLFRELYTGDLCRIDADGYIYFVSRNDAQIKHNGFRINPLEIEAAACMIEGIAEACVVQTKAPDRLHLCVTVTRPELTPGAIIADLRSRLEPFKVPDSVHILDQLPKTPNRKVDRKRLSALV